MRMTIGVHVAAEKALNRLETATGESKTSIIGKALVAYDRLLQVTEEGGTVSVQRPGAEPVQWVFL